ncbi:MFS transporter [Marinactinospora thermotolerans]|nr:MFS transporter [Marinactinospora thermotolerans]
MRNRSSDTLRSGNGAAASPPSTAGGDTDWRTSYRQVMRTREFQALWLGHALSMVGNFLLTSLVTVLVYQQTSSAIAAGFTMSLTFLPQFIGGPLLSGLADLFPRRRVMIVSDIARGLFAASVGIPGLPLWCLWILMFCSVLPLVTFGAARAALMTEIVPGERYVAGSAIINITAQVGTLTGLVAGGAIAAVVDPHLAIMANGLTFLLSAVIIRLGVRARPAPAGTDSTRPGLWELTRDGGRLVFSDPRLRTLALFGWLAGFYMVPYGLANPLAAEAGGGSSAAGLLMAGPSIGAVVGGFVLTRLVSPDRRMWLLGPMAVATSLPLLAWLLSPPLWVMVLLLILSGSMGSYQFVANAAFVLCVPSGGRGLAFGLVAAGLQVAQGVGIIVAGFAVEFVGTHVTVALAGLSGVVGAFLLSAQWTPLARETITLMNRTETAG